MLTTIPSIAALQNELIAVSIIAGIIILVVAALLISAHFDRRRLEALEAVATRLGLSFERTGERVLSESFASFPLFTTGRRKRAEAVISGLMARLAHSNASPHGEDRNLLVFDYRYTTGSGKSSHIHRQTVAAIRLSGGGMPRFALRPENVLHRIGAAFGYQDIDFDSAPDFSRKWLLRGEDELAIRAFFSARLIVALKPLEPLNIEAGGDWIVVYRADRRAKPEELESFIDRARDVAAILARA